MTMRSGMKRGGAVTFARGHQAAKVRIWCRRQFKQYAAGLTLHTQLEKHRGKQQQQQLHEPQQQELEQQKQPQ